jgi:predicted GNAT family N-acyltransferase
MSVQAKFTFGITDDAKKIRQEVFVDEQGFKDDVDEIDKTAVELVLYLDNLPIATARMYEVDPETYHVGRVCVRKPYRGHKIGSYLMKFIEVKAKSLGARKLILDSQLPREGFYLAIGYKTSGDGEVFIEEGQPHIHMEKIIVKPKANKRRYH